MIRLSPVEFKLWSGFIYEMTGINLTENKSYLIENRLQDMLTENNCNTFQELNHLCRRPERTDLRETVINRISTQETSFFRDPHVYSALGSMLLEEIIPAKRKQAGMKQPPRLRLWSAACAAGQEPYSLAMLLKETIGDLDRWDVQILASDLADNAFRKASLGQYSSLEVQRGLSPDLLDKYFTEAPANKWQVVDSIRGLMYFRKINLVADSFLSMGVFDIIFCRNVAIYFDHDTKIRLFNNLLKVLAPGGRLFVGATENLSYVLPDLKPTHRYNTLYYVKEASKNE
jgi:chemotaxis protein methyltransferase CheR